MRQYSRTLDRGEIFDPKSVDVCYGDDWRGPRGSLPLDFFAHQTKRNVLRRGDFEWRREEGEHRFGVGP